MWKEFQGGVYIELSPEYSKVVDGWQANLIKFTGTGIHKL